MKITWIEAGRLAASSVPVNAEDLHSLHDQGINAIVTLTERPITDFQTISADLLKQLDISYCHVPIPDQHPPDKAQAWQILRFIYNMAGQQRATLIHCHAGIGRTGTILHLYYLVHGWSLDEAIERVRICRPQCILLSDDQMTFVADFAREMSTETHNFEDIKGITTDGILYTARNGKLEYFEFAVCSANWLKAHPDYEELNELRWVGWRDISASPPYIEFWTEPRTRFEFNVSSICPVPINCFHDLRQKIYQLGGWLTWDRS
jgi:atypical dual specificity phosphatase